jgi:membrane associated rhomboid family serine protease
MLPLYDENETRQTPVINVLLIAANIIAFVWEFIAISERGEAAVVKEYALVPVQFLTQFSWHQFSTIFSSMFMHAGFAHLAGNLWYLWIFGDNVEDRMGKLNYLAFYLGCGVVAALTHMIAMPGSDVPTIGASGAIAGVLGAYLVLFPGVSVRTWVTWFYQPLLPAWVLIVAWFIFQIVMGTFDQSSGTGVAWFAHIGGFLAGIILLKSVMHHAEEEDPREALSSKSGMTSMVTTAFLGLGILAFAVVMQMRQPSASQIHPAVPVTPAIVRQEPAAPQVKPASGAAKSKPAIKKRRSKSPAGRMSARCKARKHPATTKTAGRGEKK